MQFDKHELDSIYYSVKKVTTLFEDDLEMLYNGQDEETEGIISRYKALQVKIKRLSI